MSRQSRLSLGLAGLLVAVVVRQSGGQAPAKFGDPLAGITPREFEEFSFGLEDFLEVESAEEGLGPAFNGTSCAVCHNVPAIGGAGIMTEVRAGRRDEQGRFAPLSPGSDSLFQMFSIPSHACQPQIPADATIIARRAPIPLFGAGLVEAIADDTLLALQDPNDENRDGISGRAAIVVDIETGDRRVGRFGWKAQHATLMAFGADAYRNEMGITNDLFPSELAFGITPERLRQCDPIPDPEDLRDPSTKRRGIDNFAAFMRFLGPPPRAAVDDLARAGERTFSEIGCAACHVPSLMTGASDNPLFHRKPVPLFSDLLLHDVGTGDGIEQASATAAEIRTPALWGLGVRRPLLHDGSASTIDQAIERHAGEAERVRAAFEALAADRRAALLTFLRGL
jgi:CxxC motif-containing protein (DUF1111 family)